MKAPPESPGPGAPGAAPRPPRRDLPFPVVALVLQGGGALGAYQAGVFQGLDEAGIEPNWVAGISIGAITSALIAGNPPELRVARLREFWETICQPVFRQPGSDLVQRWVQQTGGEARKAFNAFEAWRALVEGQRGFFVPRTPPPWIATKLPAEEVSYYDVAQLRQTLAALVDFDRINAGEMRVSVSAVNVRTGNHQLFDNTMGRWKGCLRAEHFMASGALPPGFPPVEIDGEFYWDGGLISNTPLNRVLCEWPRPDTLAFQVDLWSARGLLPTNLWDVYERQKDIQYSSRTRAITDMMAREQKMRRLIRKLLAHIESEEDLADPWCKEAQDWASDRHVSVIHLIYQEKEWAGLSKDYEFGPLSMHDHWASGLEDIRLSLAHEEWLALPADRDFVTYDLHRQAGGDVGQCRE